MSDMEEGGSGLWLLIAFGLVALGAAMAYASYVWRSAAPSGSRRAEGSYARKLSAGWLGKQKAGASSPPFKSKFKSGEREQEQLNREFLRCQQRAAPVVIPDTIRFACLARVR
jgi:hypothetical protein